eukprot:1161719-Pelagomonas_calceolata.AAC.4
MPPHIASWQQLLPEVAFLLPRFKACPSSSFCRAFVQACVSSQLFWLQSNRQRTCSLKASSVITPTDHRGNAVKAKLTTKAEAFDAPCSHVFDAETNSILGRAADCYVSPEVCQVRWFKAAQCFTAASCVTAAMALRIASVPWGLMRVARASLHVHYILFPSSQLMQVARASLHARDTLVINLRGDAIIDPLSDDSGMKTLRLNSNPETPLVDYLQGGTYENPGGRFSS